MPKRCSEEPEKCFSAKVTWVGTGCLSLLEILEIYWNYFSCSKSAGNLQSLLKISGLVCEFARLSLIIVTIFLYFRVHQYKISRGKRGSIDIEFSNLGKCQVTHLLIG